MAFVSIGLQNTAFGTLTNEQGQFVLTQLPAGKFQLVCRFQSYRPVMKSVELKEGETLELEPIAFLDDAITLGELEIHGRQNDNHKTVSVGKADIKAMDLPQSVASIDKELLDRQQTLTMSDALKNFNGVYLMGTTGGAQQEIAARGFAFSSSNTFKNGVRYNNSVLPEMSALEKVEVLKGSAAILFGNVAAGGVINLITKKPTFTKGGEISMRFDSYRFYKPSVDVYGTLNENSSAAYRVNMSYENAGSFRNEVSSKRTYINPSLAFLIGKKTKLVLEGDFLDDYRTSDFGVGSINYALIDVPRNTFLGASWSYYATQQKSATATLTHRLNKAWQIQSISAVQSFQNDLFGTARPNANNQFIRNNGNWVRGLQRTQVNEEYYITQLDLTGKFNTGFIKHQVLFGADLDFYNTITTAYNPLNRYDSINVFDVNRFTQRNDIPVLNKRIDTKSPIQRTGVYFQDLIEWSPKIKLLIGVRGSYLETKSRVFTYATKTMAYNSQYDFATTPRIGLVLQPSKKVSLFGSYANSFTPNTGTDVDGNALKPSYINQIEGGVKTILFKDVLSANVTVYQIVNSNLAQTSLVNGNTNANIKELAGEVTSKGLEADISTKSIYGFMMVAGYSYNQTKYTKSNTYIEGSLLRYNPNHTANASVYYTFNQIKWLRGFNTGLSVLYFGERQAGRSTRVTVANDPYKLFTLPAYTQVDFSIGYSYQNMSVRAKVSNLLDALSYNVHDDNSVNPIAPRQFATTLTLKF